MVCSQWPNHTICWPCLCTLLFCWRFPLQHYGNILHRVYRNDAECLVCCWCNQCTAWLKNLISIWWTWGTACNGRELLKEVRCMFSKLCWGDQWNPSLDTQSYRSWLCQGGMQLWQVLLWMSILYPGSTSDCFAFKGMSLFTRLEGGLLAPGLCLLETTLTLTQCLWQHHILRSLVAAKMRTTYITHSFVSRLNVLLVCWHTNGQSFVVPSQCKSWSGKRLLLWLLLCKLHNFCIDEKDLVPPVGAIDEIQTEMQGGIPLETTQTPTSNWRRVLLPRQLMDGVLHFDDIDRANRCNQISQYQSQADA